MQDSNSLKNKAMSGLFWSFADLLTNHVFLFIIQITLARLLLPEHFGMIGLIMVLIALSYLFIDSGLIQALIRDQNTSQVDYSTVFHFNLCVAITLYTIIYFSAPSISLFFSEPELLPIVRVLAVVLIINSLGTIQRTILVKKVDFKTIAKVNAVSAILSGTVTIVAASLGYGVWSLVINTLTMQFLQTVLLWSFNRWIPSLVFSPASFKKYFKFGYKLLLSAIIDTFYTNLYFLIIGKLYSTTQLGFYTNAVKLKDVSTQTVLIPILRVSFPILSSMQEDGERLKSNFIKIIKTSAFVNIPMFVGLMVIAPSLFSVLLGEKWLPSVVYFQLLCLGGILYPTLAINLNILQVKGRSDLFLRIEIISKAILTVLLIFTLVSGYGIKGLIGAAVISSYINFFINAYYTSKEIAYSTFEQIKDLLPIIVISVFMGFFIATLEGMLPENALLKMMIQIVIGITVYITGCKILKVHELDVIYKGIRSGVTKVKALNKKKLDSKVN